LKPQSGIAQSRQGGATRKAGWLTVKHVLVRLKSSKVDLASDRKWRKCWVSLRSGALNFYFCNEKTVSPQDLDEPSFSLEIDGCIAQAVPEHAKLDHVFSVSSRLGEAYFFQVWYLLGIYELLKSKARDTVSGKSRPSILTYRHQGYKNLVMTLNVIIVIFTISKQY